ncbi:hypothetical protein CEXT_160361 [Caerostris extrusa]|uniref:Uncharacterized protein n=1 Tax=Caerostris extrusa TaxID=172846 RepID=A0AAV4WI71_CAEEX|nr:hypothetical protein CEXT_160361 [Caerostris extrusa]
MFTKSGCVWVHKNARINSPWNFMRPLLNVNPAGNKTFLHHVAFQQEEHGYCEGVNSIYWQSSSDLLQNGVHQ